MPEITEIVLSEEENAEIKRVFELFEIGKSGIMDVTELKNGVRALNFDPERQGIRKLIKEIVEDSKNGKCSYEAFHHLIYQLMLDKVIREEISKAFHALVDADTATITFDSLKHACQEIGDPSTDEEIREMIEKADLNGDGMIDENEFFMYYEKYEHIWNC